MAGRMPSPSATDRSRARSRPAARRGGACRASQDPELLEGGSRASELAREAIGRRSERGREAREVGAEIDIEARLELEHVQIELAAACARACVVGCDARGQTGEDTRIARGAHAHEAVSP